MEQQVSVQLSRKWQTRSANLIMENKTRSGSFTENENKEELEN
jgi:hypothetical protein